MDGQGFFLLVIALLLASSLPMAHAKRPMHPKKEEAEQPLSYLMLPQPVVDLQSKVGVLWTWPNATAALLQENAQMAILELGSQGMYLPMYGNLHTLCYISQGRAVAGLLHPSGDPTNVRYVGVGDLFAVPAGWISWLWNSASLPFRAICFNNAMEQKSYSAFYLAGRNGILRGFSQDLLARALGVEEEKVVALLNCNNATGIIEVQEEQLRFQDVSKNDILGDYAMNMKLTRPDVLESGGRIVRLSGEKMKILKELGISATLVDLRGRAMVGPKWANSQGQLVYVLMGEGRAEVVSEQGVLVLNETLKAGNVFVVPPFYPHVVVAGDDGLEFISFHIATEVIPRELAGSRSVWKAIPLDIISAYLNCTRKIAEQIQSSRDDEDFIFSLSAL